MEAVSETCALEKSVHLFLCGEIGSPFLCFLCAASEGEDCITLELHQQSGGSRLLEIQAGFEPGSSECQSDATGALPLEWLP